MLEKYIKNHAKARNINLKKVTGNQILEIKEFLTETVVDLAHYTAKDFKEAIDKINEESKFLKKKGWVSNYKDKDAKQIIRTFMNNIQCDLKYRNGKSVETCVAPNSWGIKLIQYIPLSLLALSDNKDYMFVAHSWLVSEVIQTFRAHGSNISAEYLKEYVAGNSVKDFLVKPHSSPSRYGVEFHFNPKVFEPDWVDLVMDKRYQFIQELVGNPAQEFRDKYPKHPRI